MTDLIEKLKNADIFTDAVDEAINEIINLRSANKLYTDRIATVRKSFNKLFRLMRYFVWYFDMHRINNKFVSESKSILYDVNGLPEQHGSELEDWKSV